MNPRTFIDKAVDRLWRAPRGFNRTYDQAFWDKAFGSGAWDHLAAVSEAARYALIANYARQLRPGGDVLDVGCGTGVLRDHLGAGLAYTGLDISNEAIRIAKSRGDGDFQVADFEAFTSTAAHEVVVFNETLTYAADPGVTFRNYWARLPAGGVIIVSICDHDARNRANWSRFEPEFRARHASRLINEKGQAWDIKAYVKDA